MMPLTEQLISSARSSRGFFFKFVSGNDAGRTGAHQAGFYMPVDVWSLFFDGPGEKGENRDVRIRVRWPGTAAAHEGQGGLGEHTTESRFVWYGRGTKSEYRLTGGFNFLAPDNVGDMLVLVRRGQRDFDGFLLSRDAEIDAFLEAFSLSPADAYRLQRKEDALRRDLTAYCESWVAGLTEEFPTAQDISARAREFLQAHPSGKSTRSADDRLIEWVDTEFALFKQLEGVRYRHLLEKPFETTERLIETANTVLNRRKSRSGLALENHLRYLFTSLKLPFAHQETTEGRSRPDFIFPSILHYRDPSFPSEQLTFLGVKTTCKDRWRQILPEAARIPVKHLLTLQQGVSEHQMGEMAEHGVVLVVPAAYHRLFPRGFRSRLKSVEEFVTELRAMYVQQVA